MYAKRKEDPLSVTDEIFSLASGPLVSAFSYSACIVNGVKFVCKSLDDRRTKQILVFLYQEKIQCPFIVSSKKS